MGPISPQNIAMFGQHLETTERQALEFGPFFSIWIFCTTRSVFNILLIQNYQTCLVELEFGRGCRRTVDCLLLPLIGYLNLDRMFWGISDWKLEKEGRYFY